MKCPDCTDGIQQRWDDYKKEMLTWKCLTCNGTQTVPDKDRTSTDLLYKPIFAWNWR